MSEYTRKVQLVNNFINPITGQSFNSGLGYHPPPRMQGGAGKIIIVEDDDPDKFQYEKLFNRWNEHKLSETNWINIMKFECGVRIKYVKTLYDEILKEFKDSIYPNMKTHDEIEELTGTDKLEKLWNQAADSYVLGENARTKWFAYRKTVPEYKNKEWNTVSRSITSIASGGDDMFYAKKNKTLRIAYKTIANIILNICTNESMYWMSINMPKTDGELIDPDLPKYYIIPYFIPSEKKMKGGEKHVKHKNTGKKDIIINDEALKIPSEIIETSKNFLDDLIDSESALTYFKQNLHDEEHGKYKERYAVYHGQHMQNKKIGQLKKIEKKRERNVNLTKAEVKIEKELIKLMEVNNIENLDEFLEKIYKPSLKNIEKDTIKDNLRYKDIVLPPGKTFEFSICGADNEFSKKIFGDKHKNPSIDQTDLIIYEHNLNVSEDKEIGGGGEFCFDNVDFENSFFVEMKDYRKCQGYINQISFEANLIRRKQWVANNNEITDFYKKNMYDGLVITLNKFAQIPEDYEFKPDAPSMWDIGKNEKKDDVYKHDAELYLRKKAQGRNYIPIFNEHRQVINIKSIVIGDKGEEFNKYMKDEWFNNGKIYKYYILVSTGIGILRYCYTDDVYLKTNNITDFYRLAPADRTEKGGETMIIIPWERFTLITGSEENFNIRGDGFKHKITRHKITPKQLDVFLHQIEDDEKSDIKVQEKIKKNIQTVIKKTV